MAVGNWLFDAGIHHVYDDENYWQILLPLNGAAVSSTMLALIFPPTSSWDCTTPLSRV